MSPGSDLQELGDLGVQEDRGRVALQCSERLRRVAVGEVPVLDRRHVAEAAGVDGGEIRRVGGPIAPQDHVARRVHDGCDGRDAVGPELGGRLATV